MQRSPSPRAGAASVKRLRGEPKSKAVCEPVDVGGGLAEVLEILKHRVLIESVCGECLQGETVGVGFDACNRLARVVDRAVSIAWSAA